MHLRRPMVMALIAASAAVAAANRLRSIDSGVGPEPLYRLSTSAALASRGLGMCRRLARVASMRNSHQVTLRSPESSTPHRSLTASTSVIPRPASASRLAHVSVGRAPAHALLRHSGSHRAWTATDDGRRIHDSSSPVRAVRLWSG
jgi:hypothetical protein